MDEIVGIQRGHTFKCIMPEEPGLWAMWACSRCGLRMVTDNSQQPPTYALCDCDG